MAETLEIIITAKDEASKVFKKIGDTSKQAFGTALKIGAAGAGALAVGLGASVAAALDAEVSFAKLNSVIESTGGVAGVTIDEAQGLADALAKVTRFSDETIEGGETLLLTFTGIGEDVFPRATETMLNMGEAFGNVDGAAIQLGKALNDPVAGIGALAEVGVSFTEEQKNMVAAMVEAGDIAGAQTLILDELEVEFGNMARAAGDTAAGKLAIFKNSLIDVAQSIGAIFLPFLSRGLDRLIEFVAPIGQVITNFGLLIQKVGEFGAEAQRTRAWAMTLFGFETGARIADIIVKFGEVRDALSDFLTSTIIPFVQQHLPAFKNALLAVGAVIGGAVVLGGILTLIGTLGLLLNPITLIIVGIAVLAAAWTEDWLGIRTFLTATWNNHIKPVLQAFADWFVIVLPLAVAYITAAWEDVIKPALESIGDFIEEAVLPALQSFASWFVDSLPLAAAFMTSAWENVIRPALDAFLLFVQDVLLPGLQLLLDFFQIALPIAVAFVGTAWDVIKFTFELMIVFITDLLIPVFMEIVEFFEVALPAAFSSAKSVWASVLEPVFKAIRNIAREIGEFLGIIPEAIDGFIDALGRIQMPPALQVIVDALTAAANAANSLLGGGGGGGSEFGGSTPQNLTGIGGEDIAVGGTQAPPDEFPVGGGASNVSLLGGGQTFALTVNTSAPVEDIVRDFDLMQAWAGV